MITRLFSLSPSCCNPVKACGTIVRCASVCSDVCVILLLFFSNKRLRFCRGKECEGGEGGEGNMPPTSVICKSSSAASAAETPG